MLNLKIFKRVLVHLFSIVLWVHNISKHLIIVIWRNGLFALITVNCVFIVWWSTRATKDDVKVMERSSIIAYIENSLEKRLKLDKGTGCQIPDLNPFSKEVMQFDKKMPKLKCKGQDWVKCQFSECKVIREVLDIHTDISCTYRDILYESDQKYTIGDPVEVRGADVYHLTKSDHVKISCKARNRRKSFFNIIPVRWKGLATGLRSTVTRHPPPKGRENTINILIFAFDSAARTGFIRRMPKSYKYLTENLRATILKSYNIVGDGNPAALFPILTGKNELEMPDVRKKMKNNNTCDDMPFLFYKLRDDGYRTAYLEDMPWIGTFQHRFNGFRRQPADHYLRSFLMEEYAGGELWWGDETKRYCVGDTPQYKLMMNLTKQFLHLDGKKFGLTFIADITHEDFNMISNADEDFVDFMKQFKSDGFIKDTMLIVMGDHGPRYALVRASTLQGKLEERLPLMALVVPEVVRTARPRVLRALRYNVRALTTPHDIHATLLDALQLRDYWNPHKVGGADLPRGMTLFEPIPRNRSCSEAGIEPHWCACLIWRNVSQSDPLHRRASQALVDYINSLTEPVRSMCAVRTLSYVSWVMKQLLNNGVLSFVGGDRDGYFGKFGKKMQLKKETYQVKITVGPGSGDFEASMTYLVDKDEFHVDGRDVSRTNMYGNEPDCISTTHPHLNPYCYCLQGTTRPMHQPRV